MQHTPILMLNYETIELCDDGKQFTTFHQISSFLDDTSVTTLKATQLIHEFIFLSHKSWVDLLSFITQKL